MMKKITLVLFLAASISFGQFRIGEAKGLFMSIGVGPRFPVSTMADYSNIGSGVNVNFSYTDNAVIPVFFYTSIGYQHFPGRQDLYKRTDYSSFSSNVLVVASGIRYYFRPMFEQVVLLMPVVDIGAEYALFENWNQFKAGSLQRNSVTELNKFGFHAGAGFSMFLLDFMAYYNYLPDANYISVDLRVNLPIFIKI
ncbi:MAG: hypothetical protein WCZ90_10185 [Melioribacteraceae bacterium]